MLFCLKKENVKEIIKLKETLKKYSNSYKKITVELFAGFVL